MDTPPTFATGPDGVRVEILGDGEPILFVHGGGKPGFAAWQAQRPLSKRYELRFLTRLGYPPNAPTPREDFERDGDTIAGLLDDPLHLVAHSYGAVGTLLAAARRPDQIRSLTLVEPGATSIALDVPVVRSFEDDMERARTTTRGASAEEQIRAVFRVIEPAHPLPTPLPPPLVDFGRRLPGLRWPHEADVPLAALAAAGFPRLVVTGGGRPVYEAVADRLVEAIGARRAVVPGPHAVQDTGAPFNEALVGFLTEVGTTQPVGA